MRSCFVIGIMVLALCLIFIIDPTFAYELIEPPPDSIQAPEVTQSYYHLYGTETGEFNIGEAYPWFDNVFNLYVSDRVGQWDSTEVADFVLLVMDSDSTNSDDIFPLVWDYFCYGDSDMTYAGVKFKVGTQIFTDIDMRLYDKRDIDCPGPFECNGYSWYSGGNLFTLNATTGDMDPD